MFRIDENPYVLEINPTTEMVVFFRPDWTPEMRGAAVLVLEDCITRNFDAFKGRKTKIDLDNE